MGTQSDGVEVRVLALHASGDRRLTPGTTVNVPLDAYSKTSTVLLAYAGAGAPTGRVELRAGQLRLPPCAPSVAGSHAAGSAVVRFGVDKASAAHTWTRTGGSRAARAATAGSGSGTLTAMAADLVLPAASGVPR